MTGAIVRCFRLTDYLERVLRNLSDIDKIIVANYRYNGVEDLEDKTPEIAKKFSNVILKQGIGKEQHEVFNECVKELKDCDWIFINDADEFLLPKDRGFILEQCNKFNPDAGLACVLDYADAKHIYPKRSHHPVVIVKPSTAFYTTRCINADYCLIFHDINIHHFGYVFDKETLDWKRNGEWYKAEKNEITRMINKKPLKTDTPKELLELLGDL
jgi:hypothetical protein